VLATASQTGAQTKAVINVRGEFTFPTLLPTQYTITVTAAGFQAYKRSGILLEANQALTVNIQLAVGAATQTVNVSVAPPQINTTGRGRRRKRLACVCVAYHYPDWCSLCRTELDAKMFCKTCKLVRRVKHSRTVGLLFHDLRRSAARNARNSGVSENLITKMGGWRTRAMFDRYAIVGEDDLDEAIRRARRAQNGHTHEREIPAQPGRRHSFEADDFCFHQLTRGAD
jgi:hypothetical protein